MKLSQELEAFEDQLDPPGDWCNPYWGVSDRVHNWRNYASSELQTQWANLSRKHRIIIAACLDEIASNEEWD